MIAFTQIENSKFYGRDLHLMGNSEEGSCNLSLGPKKLNRKF